MRINRIVTTNRDPDPSITNHQRKATVYATVKSTLMFPLLPRALAERLLGDTTICLLGDVTCGRAGANL